MEKEGVLTEHGTDTFMAFGRDDEGHDTVDRGQAFDYSFGSGNKGNGMSCDRTGRVHLYHFLDAIALNWDPIRLDFS